MSDPATVLSRLEEALQDAGSYNPNDVVAPAAILWTDKTSSLSKLIPALRSTLPILTLGPYDPETLTGPIIWLRCVLAGALSVPGLSEGIPIIYLPGIGRQDLRAVESCPEELQPLLELQYRGAYFSQKNGRDWTPHAFLQGHLGIKVSEDQATRVALDRAVVRVFEEDVKTVAANAPLDASYLNSLLNPDPVRQILSWMNQPAEEKRRMTEEDPGIWSAFEGLSKHRFGLEPEREGAVTAAEKLAAGEGEWSMVWTRFKESPHRYPHLPDLLRRAGQNRPHAINYFESEAWPQDNEAAEERLRQGLLALAEMPGGEARQAIENLEAENSHRRSWVWAELGMAPMARVLVPLTRLATATSTPVGTGSPTEIADRYSTSGWEADLAALESLAGATNPAEEEAVKAAVEAIYRPWLEEGARTFQRAVNDHGLPRLETRAEPVPGRCILFTDGLRYDVGQALVEELESRGASVNTAWRFGALPGVTATAKPALTPVAELLGAGKEFSAVFETTTVTAPVLRRVLEDAGFQIITESHAGDPTGSGWMEYGNLDSLGHAEGWRLSRRFRNEVKNIAARISGLLANGWQEVVVVTDHGWLLLPQSLPKVELPEHLTVVRKGRCARLKPSSTTDYQTVPWFFDPEVQIAVAPGIGNFIAGQDYEHGGLSVQETVLPMLTVTSELGAVASSADIDSLRWVGLRCRVTVTGAPEGLTADLRTKSADPSTSVLFDRESKPLSTDGQVSLAADDAHEGEAVHLVILSADGAVLLQRTTTVGADT